MSKRRAVFEIGQVLRTAALQLGGRMPVTPQGIVEAAALAAEEASAEGEYAQARVLLLLALSTAARSDAPGDIAALALGTLAVDCARRGHHRAAAVALRNAQRHADSEARRRWLAGRRAAVDRVKVV